MKCTEKELKKGKASSDNSNEQLKTNQQNLQIGR